MKLTAAQKMLAEMDFQSRRRERENNKLQQYVDLVRKGRIRVHDLVTAAVWGDQEARKAAETFGEDPPTIENPADILHMFGTSREDLIIIFKTLYDHLRKSGYGWHRTGVGSGTETAGWALGMAHFNEDEDATQEAAQYAIGELARTFGLELLIEVLKKRFIIPILGGDPYLPEPS